MKILYVVRLFSGLENSLISRQWNPAGVPAVYKMIEALDRGNDDLRLVFTCKDYESRWQEKKDRTFRIKGLDSEITVLIGSRSFSGRIRFFRGVLREIRQTIRIWRIYKKFRPDVLYFDRANFIQAGLFARFTKIPVVLRLMGVGTMFLREVIKGKRPSRAIARWAFRSPFAFVLCTQDGSGVERWLDDVITKDVPCKTLINGVDLDTTDESTNWILNQLPGGRTIILFVGRLERLKGCEEFMRGFLLALNRAGGDIHAVLVGEGSLSRVLHRMVEKHDAADHVTFLNALPHDQVIAVNMRADIYVSLDRGGNLSNANLEAMRSGCCMVFPASQPESGIDVITDQLIPENTALRIPSADDTEALADAIVFLRRHPHERMALGQNIAERAAQFIPTWGERINAEIDLLRNKVIAKGS